MGDGMNLVIKEYRLKKNFTQKQLAKHINISQSYLSKLERNTTSAINGVSLGIILKLANALDVNISSIIKSKDRL